MSIMWSATLMMSMLCSMTNTVLPWSTSFQHIDQLLHILEMQAGGRLVQDVEGAARIALAEFGGEFDALRLTTAQGGAALAEGHVSQTHVEQGTQFHMRSAGSRRSAPACSTGMASTSAMLLPLKRTSSVSRS
jgi:hypothetical protein